MDPLEFNWTTIAQISHDMPRHDNSAEKPQQADVSNLKKARTSVVTIGYGKVSSNDHRGSNRNGEQCNPSPKGCGSRPKHCITE